MIPTVCSLIVQEVVFRLPATFNSQAIDGCVNRTPCNIACTDVNSVSTQHIALMCYRLTRGSSCAFHIIFIPSLVLRHVSRLAQHTQHFDFSFVHRLRLNVDHVQNTLRRFTRPRSDGFTDPEPRTHATSVGTRIVNGHRRVPRVDVAVVEENPGPYDTGGLPTVTNLLVLQLSSLFLRMPTAPNMPTKRIPLAALRNVAR